MTQEAVQGGIELRDGVLVGPLRRPAHGPNAGGSIHDDAVASKLGFRGGAVAGSIHLELFPPLLRQAFGQRWFERGTLSIYFLNATTDHEYTHAFLQQPSAGATDVQVSAWLERDDGMRMGEGTASIGDPGEPTALGGRPLDRFEPGELRILASVKPGDALPEVETSFTAAEQATRLALTTEPLDWYGDASPWGRPVVPPAGMVQLLYLPIRQGLHQRTAPAIGLYGAIELRNVNGPVVVDQPYRVSGTVLAVGQSPKTEYLWYETELKEPDGRHVAGMRMMLRWMKASSPLYAD
jgi:hypothetical protein